MMTCIIPPCGEGVKFDHAGCDFCEDHYVIEDCNKDEQAKNKERS